jgi:hypothetical protein
MAISPSPEIRNHVDLGATVNSRNALSEPNQTRTYAAAAVFGIDLQDTDERLGQTPVCSPEQPQPEHRSRLPILLGDEKSTRGVFRQDPKAGTRRLQPRLPSSAVRGSEFVEICMSEPHCPNLRSPLDDWNHPFIKIYPPLKPSTTNI